MDHETLLIDLADARARMAVRPCPWCAVTNWSAGYITATAISSVNRDGGVVFAYTGGAPAAALQSAVFTCQACQYQVTFTLRMQANHSV
jgi:hypothetical protein